MFNLSSPETSALSLAVVLIGLNQMLKTKLHWEDTRAEILSFLVGALAGVAWYAAFNALAIDAQSVFGVVLSALAFGLVPSGLYKFTMSVADTASKGKS